MASVPSTALDDPLTLNLRLQGHLSAVYALTQNSRHLFASPLGPFQFAGRSGYLPRLVFFGPLASDVAWRIAFLAGFDRHDWRSSHALLALAEQLAEDSERGHGLDVTFFPLVDAAGALLGSPDRALGGRPWKDAQEPELRLLERDARVRRYHGFVRLETGDLGEEVASIRICGAVAELFAPDLALITSEDTDAFPVRFESGLTDGDRNSGPLSFADHLPFTPFELTLRIPGAWPDATYRRVVVNVLQRFLWRYRAFQAYGQNL